MGKVKKEPVANPVIDQKSKMHVPKKKKNSEKRNSDEWNRKFGYILPQSVKCMAESVGMAGLPEEVANSLAEDVSYRLRSIIQLCTKYLKHTRHKRLTCEDVNEVLQMCDIPTVIGHATRTVPCNFINFREIGIFAFDDPVIDLATYALNEVCVPIKPLFSVAGKWATEEQGVKVKTEEVKNEAGDAASGNTFAEKEGDGRREEQKHVENEPRITTDLIKYYGITCNSILGHCDLKVVLRDLARNGKIVPVIPYILNFITITLNKLGYERQCVRLLHAIEALTENTQIDFRPYHPVTRVSNSLIKIIKSVAIEKKREHAGNSLERAALERSFCQKSLQSNNQQLRCRAAQVLSKVLERWCCSEQLRDTVVDDMSKLIRDLHVPAGVHIGAIALLNELGPDALVTGLWSFLDQFLTYLRVVRQDKRALELMVLNAAEILYRNPHFTMTKGVPPACHLDAQLYEYFGDALCCRRLQLTENPHFLQRFQEGNSTLDFKSDIVIKRPSRLPKCRNSMYNPGAKKATIHTAFQLPKLKRKRNPRIIFKFAGANPVPEMSLRRRRLDSRYSQFIAGKVSEGHVVLVGKLCRRLKQKPANINMGSASLFSVL